MVTHTPAYQQAFRNYLRYGTPIHLSLKASGHPTTHYIWHTRGDDKVRPSHAANNGKIFAWDNPPATGNPGEEYGCRCWAEPYYGIIDTIIDDVSTKITELLAYFRNILLHVNIWKNRHFVAYFYVGGGRAVTLEEIGHLTRIRNYYETHYLQRFKNQLQQRAVHLPDGKFTDDFKHSYDFGAVSYPHGGSTIAGKFTGKIETLPSGKRVYSGNVSVAFSDVFTDPIRVIDHVMLEIPTVGQPYEWIALLAEVGGAKYDIRGNWETTVSGEINASDSHPLKYIS